MNPDTYLIRPDLVIPAHDVWFEFSHSSGPGGQNVNKTATAATLCFHPASSGVLSDWEKNAIARRLANRINSDGVLRITCETQRSQSANRAGAASRFQELLAEALIRPKSRRPTRPTRSSIEQRLANKRHRSARKSTRNSDDGDPWDE